MIQKQKVEMECREPNWGRKNRVEERWMEKTKSHEAGDVVEEELIETRNSRSHREIAECTAA